jgi:hypothetical protein
LILIPGARLRHTEALMHLDHCRQLRAFVFVFEAANRIVVEKPEFKHATYFFEIEEPLPVASQAWTSPISYVLVSD